MSSFFCEDDKYHHGMSMLDLQVSGKELTDIEYEKYEIFEAGGKDLLEHVTDDDPFSVPPFSMVSLHITLPEEV